MAVDPIRPVGPSRRVADRRAVDRRGRERRSEAAEAQLPVPVSPPHDHDPKPAPGVAGAYSAQLIGQASEKRGLRGGPPVLEGARSAYLEAEYLGPKDRRARKGKVTKTEI